MTYKPRSSVDVTDLRSVKSTDDELVVGFLQLETPRRVRSSSCDLTEEFCGNKNTVDLTFWNKIYNSEDFSGYYKKSSVSSASKFVHSNPEDFSRNVILQIYMLITSLFTNENKHKKTSETGYFWSEAGVHHKYNVAYKSILNLSLIHI